MATYGPFAVAEDLISLEDTRPHTPSGSITSDPEAGSVMSGNMSAGQPHPLHSSGDLSVDGVRPGTPYLSTITISGNMSAGQPHPYHSSGDLSAYSTTASVASGASLHSFGQSQHHLDNNLDNEEFTFEYAKRNNIKGSGTTNNSGTNNSNNSNNSMKTNADHLKAAQSDQDFVFVNLEKGNLKAGPSAQDFENTSVSVIPPMMHEENRHQFQTKVRISSPTDVSADTNDTFNDSPNDSPNASPRIKHIRFADKNEVREYTPNPEEFEDNPTDVFDHSGVGCGMRARHFFATSALPFMYGATSSLTTLFFFYELMVRYGRKPEIIGFYLVGAYLCRVVFNSISRYAPKTFVLVGSMMALLGFVAIFVSQSPEFMELNEKMVFEDDGLILFIVGSVLANCNETIGAMQMFVRDQNKENMKVMGSQLKMHYFVAKMARVGSFIGGGFLYQIYGVHGVAALGVGLVSLQILCLILFFVLDLFRHNHDPNNNKFGDEFIDLSPKCRLNCSIAAARGRRRLFKSTMSKLNRSLSKYYPSDIPPSSVRFIVPICVFGRTISSICIWSSSALILVDDFETDFVTVGAIFGSAAAVDFLVSLFALSEMWNKKKLPTKLGVYICMAGITLSSTATAAPKLYAFIVGFMLYAICNSILRILLTELQGSSNNATESFTVQLIRRICTAGALYSLPLLYMLHPRLPLVLALWFALFSSTILAVSLACCRTSAEIQKLDNSVNQNIARSGSFRARPSRRPERNLLYAEQIMLGRLIKGKDV